MFTEKPLYVVVSYIQSRVLSEGRSPYPAVNLRRNGLKISYDNKYPNNEKYDVLQLTTYKVEWWNATYEVIDKPKFMLARIKLGV